MKYVAGAECEVAVIGLGYVGLPAALMFANSGLKTIGVDINMSLLSKIRQGSCPLEEKGLSKIFDDPSTKANFSVRESAPISEAYVIAVPTPLDSAKKVADLNAVVAACKSIVPVLQKGALVIIESTIPPLTCRNIAGPILESSGLKIGRDILVAHCPERLFPGNVVEEIVHNSRIVGGANQAATDRAAELYVRFVKGEINRTDDVTEEFSKLIENAFRDVNIALANELAAVAEHLGIKIEQAIAMANKHPRVKILKPGIGVGGHCIPIDPWFIAEVAPNETALIPVARRINDRQPERVAAKIRKAVAHIADPCLAIYGVTYKPDVNDQRESPAWQVVELLRQDGYRLDIYDPVAGPMPRGNPIAFAKGHDALVILVEHSEIVDLLANAGSSQILGALAQPIILRF